MVWVRAGGQNTTTPGTVPFDVVEASDFLLAVEHRVGRGVMAPKAVKMEGKKKAQPNPKVDEAVKTEDQQGQLNSEPMIVGEDVFAELLDLEPGVKKARKSPKSEKASKKKLAAVTVDTDGDDVVEEVSKKKRPRKEHAEKAVDEQGAFPPLSGCLPTSKCRSQMEFPVKIPEEYYDAGLPFSLEGAGLEVKKEEIEEPAASDPLPPAAYSDAKAACLHGVKELIRDGRSGLHSLSPAMMSGLIHFFDFTKAEEKAKSSGKKAAPKDEAMESLLALRHDEGVLKKRLKGWSYFGKDKHHMVVNLMDQPTEPRAKKARAKSHMAPAAES